MTATIVTPAKLVCRFHGTHQAFQYSMSDHHAPFSDTGVGSLWVIVVMIVLLLLAIFFT